jgi:hypothetical protein
MLGLSKQLSGTLAGAAQVINGTSKTKGLKPLIHKRKVCFL